jgi:predicted DsbA family dithiol-disulfide isomerase
MITYSGDFIESFFGELSKSEEYRAMRQDFEAVAREYVGDVDFEDIEVIVCAIESFVAHVAFQAGIRAGLAARNEVKRVAI